MFIFSAGPLIHTGPYLEWAAGLALGTGADLDLRLRVLEERPQRVPALGTVVFYLHCGSTPM